MASTLETQVLIVGAGPVGLTLAMDLAWRGVDVIVAERRPAGAAPNVKCSQISARSMEIFRRLGIARTLRETGLPADYPNDVVSCTTVTGMELSRVPIPSRGERFGAPQGPDTWWPTPEPPHRINQIFFEPVLFAHARSQPRIRILDHTDVESFTRTQTASWRLPAISRAASRCRSPPRIWSAAMARDRRFARRSEPT
jgi:2-polyprenyl-6-methoxyphenol hydroxylase-like FAD-dependent oxidoreductase